MPVRIYLDHAATTPIRPEALAAMAEGFARWANPSSPHAEGRAARKALEDARARIAGALGWTGEVILTSGASEAIALAMRGRRWTAGAVEHDAVLRWADERLPVDGKGRVFLPHGASGDPRIDRDGLPPPGGSPPAKTPDLHPGRAEPVEARPSVVSDGCPSTGAGRTGWVGRAIQHANSETGVLQPVAGDGPVRLADCAQSAGKLPLPDADLIAVSAHKLGGPPGIGALLVRDLGLLQPTGGQEKGYRPGTENLPAALGFAAALEASRDWLDAMPPIRAKLDAAIEAAGGDIIARDAPRIATIASYRMPRVTSAAQLIRFDMAGFAVSAGSACSSGTMKRSHVLEAMRYPHPDEVIRVSFGWTTTAAEVDAFAAAWTRIAAEAQARAA